MPDGGVVLVWVTVTGIVTVFCGVEVSLIVIVAEPIEMPLTVMVEPETVTVALFVSDDCAMILPAPPLIVDVAVWPSTMLNEDGLAVMPPEEPPGGVLPDEEIVKL